jgi:outer membrane protein TolC
MTRSHLCALALGLAITATPVSAQPAAPELLSLDAAVSMARARNLGMQAQRLDADKQREQLTAFRSQRRPLFDVRVASGTLLAPFSFRFPTGSLGTLTSVGPVPPEPSTITSEPGLSTILYANVTQPLTQLRRLTFGEQALRRGLTLAAEETRLKESELVTSVRKLYYGIVQAEATVHAQQESLNLSQEVARLIGQYESTRAALPADVLTANVGVLEQTYKLDAARRQAQAYREQLNAVLERSLDEPFVVEALQPARVSDEDLAAAETKATADRPEVRASKLQVERAELARRATKGPLLPDVSLSFQYLSFSGFEFLPRQGALLGVLATWEPWDWGRAKAEQAEKRLVETQASLMAGNAATQVRVDVRARFRALQDAAALLTVTDAAREAARERLRVATARFAEDAALQRDVLAAQAALSGADQAAAQALANYWIARAEFERARGDL